MIPDCSLDEPTNEIAHVALAFNMIDSFKQLYGGVTAKPLEKVIEKAEEPEIKLPTSAGSSKKQESSRKTSISVLLTMPKPSTVWITINCGNF